MIEEQPIETTRSIKSFLTMNGDMSTQKKNRDTQSQGKQVEEDPIKRAGESSLKNVANQKKKEHTLLKNKKTLTTYTRKDQMRETINIEDEQPLVAEKESEVLPTKKKRKYWVNCDIEESDEEDVPALSNSHRTIQQLIPDIQDPTAKQAIKEMSEIIDHLQRKLRRAMIGDTTVMDFSKDPIDTTLDHLRVPDHKRGATERALNMNEAMRQQHRFPSTSDLQRVYIYGLAYYNLGVLRRQLATLGFNTQKMYNLTFVGKHLLEVVTTKSYLPHLTSKVKKLVLLKINVWPDFDPLMPNRLAVDPEFARARARHKYMLICQANIESTKILQVREFYQGIMKELEEERENTMNLEGAAGRGGAQK